jgi:hypothetical protein
MKKKLLTKTIALTLAASLLLQSFLPQKLFAMNGPQSPEFSNFSPIGSSGMVNDFTGSFSYNLPVISIPGPDGGGYALNLSYSSDLSPEADASWVGYGWNLNPGAIVRGKQGFPDDMNAGTITKFNKAPSDLTASISASTSAEAFSFDLPVDLSATALYNSYNGLSVSAAASYSLSSYGLSMTGSLTTTGDHSFDAGFSPGKCFNDVTGTALKKADSYMHQAFLGSKLHDDMANWKGFSVGKYCSYSLANQSRPTYVRGYDGFSIGVSIDVQAAPLSVPAGVGVKLEGKVSMHFPIESEDMEYYGYLYSHNAEKGNNILMDYTVEKESPYNERDYYLAIPYSAADNFMVMGEGIGGSFRAYSRTPGHFRANTRASYTVFSTAGIDGMLGMTLGGGGSISLGSQALTSDEWYDDNDFRFNNDEDESYYFMFNGDMGSSVDYGGVDAVQFEPSGSDLAGWDPEAPSSETLYSQPNNSSERVARSSYIGYHTIEEIQETDGNSKNYKRYNYRSDIENLADRASANSNQIGEFAVCNADGNNYVYGLPVYVKGEKSASVNIEPSVGSYIIHPDLNAISINDANDDVDIDNVSDDITTLIGEEMASDEKYANTWLLTQITTPNYLDLLHDGPSDDDFGGWTIFNYTKTYGDHTSSWYKYRIPYTGLFNNPGRLSDSKDDMGSFSSGYKEMYYVESIETKTHKAVFTISNRYDGFDADHDDDVASSDENAMGANPLKKLDKIELYAKESNELIQTVYFEYYQIGDEVFPGQPNSNDGGGNKTGKLTLKRVYMEYANVKSPQISPYEFIYEYPTTVYPSQYTALESYGSTLSQNPNYNALNYDRWGYYQAKGEERYNMMNPWVDQSPDTDNSGTATNFDPAAGLLKQIILPSGGQIHIQYEQNEYLYVQNKRAMAMVNISSIDKGSSLYDGQEDNTYYLNLVELDIDSEDEIDALESLIQSHFIDGEERMYFKFLYSLRTAEGSLGDCGMDWIDGYVKVREVGQNADGTALYIKLGDDAWNGSSILQGDESYDVPREVCVDFYNQTRAGKIDITGGAAACELNDLTTDEEGAEAEDFLYELVEVFDAAATFLGAEGICAYMDETNSYLRIPLSDTNPKKGGGVRVKRIITYDQGLEGDLSDATLYGLEYIYLTTDSICSGVATNEPAQGDDENALVKYLDKRQDSNWAQRVISGRDKEQFEGPVGANILPSASIGYSRVVCRSLYDGATPQPLTVKGFYTCKDYPVQVNNTDIKKESSWIPVPGYPISSNITKVWSTQGYSIILNNMHGQIKHEATYSYNDDNINSNLILVGEKKYEYAEPGTAVNGLSSWEWIDGGNFEYEIFIPGQHTEVVMESREVIDVTIDAKTEFDVSVGIVPMPPFLIPYVTVMPYLNYTEDNLRTHVLNKITFSPAALISVTASIDGITSINANEYINKETGSAVVTSVNDGYDGLQLNGSSTEHNGTYYNINFPASHFYADMAAKSTNEQMYVESTSDFSMSKLVTDNNGDLVGDEFYLSLSGNGICDNVDAFTSGSLIAIYDNDSRTNPDIYHIGEINGGMIELLPTNYFYYDNSTNSPTGVNIEILRSGKTNQLSAGVGSITSYGGLPTATLNEISDEMSAQREALLVLLNGQLNGTGSVSLSTDEIASLQELGIINPVTGECGNFTEIFSDPAYTSGSGSGSGSSSSSHSGYNISVGQRSNPYSYSVEVCETIPASIVNCDYVGSVLLCDTIPEQIYCHNELRFYNHDEIVVGFDNYSEVSDGIDNDGDGSIDESDEGVDECETVLQYVDGYEFFLDEENYEIMYGDSDNTCDAVQIECIDFCPDEYASVSLDKIVAAGAVSLSDDWSYSSYISDAYNVSTTDNVYETGEKGRWNPLSTYAYNTTVSNITDVGAFTYNTADFDDFTLFNWNHHAANDSTNWLQANTIEYYSPNGIPLQESNLLDIKSCVKYGYQKTLPYLMAANADYKYVFFENFENATLTGSSIEFEDSYSLSSSSFSYGYFNTSQWNQSYAHSGSRSFKPGFLDDPATAKPDDFKCRFSLKRLERNDDLSEDGISVKLWVKKVNLDTELESMKLIIENLYDPAYTISVDFERLAVVGEWELYQAKSGPFVDSQWIGILGAVPEIYMVHTDSDASIYIDDVRVQPLSAQVTTYVYDPDNLRLLTQFDDQHFGLYYQYNDEGKLTRKLVETERGTKTIAETLYHTPTVNK